MSLNLPPHRSHRRYLVVVRAGNGSLHKEWIASADRDFDLFVSYFGSDPGTHSGDGEYYEARKGPKWSCLYDLFCQHPSLVEEYDAFWLPDDDLSASAATINRMFALFKGFDLALAQPALTADSYYSWAQLIQRPEFTLRFVNFVEVMAPLFTRDSLRQCLNTFNESASGWGLDFVWPRLCAREGARAVAILDMTPVKHTRPIGGELYKNNPQLDPGRDSRAMLDKYGLADVPGLFRHTQLGGIGPVRLGRWETLVLAIKRLNARRLARRRRSRSPRE